MTTVQFLICFIVFETIILILLAYLWLKEQKENYRLAKECVKSFQKGYNKGSIESYNRWFSDMYSEDNGRLGNGK